MEIVGLITDSAWGGAGGGALQIVYFYVDLGLSF